MKTCVLENEKLKVTVRAKSAELTSIVKKETGKEYLWNADPSYWGWSSPILFPAVGACRNNTYRWEGTDYEIQKHGFARHMEFTLISEDTTECWWALEPDENTRKVFPFEFRLEIGYRLEDSQIRVMWKVTNPDEKEMYFAIGAHPAFRCPLEEGQKQSDCYITVQLNTPCPRYKLVDQEGMVSPEEYEFAVEDGNMHKIREDEFARDALIFDDNQISGMYLNGPDYKPYVFVEFPDAPSLGVWAPNKEGVPFVCIEPWYGRNDNSGFEGDLSERPYINHLQAGGIFEKEYTIRIM